MAALSEKLTRLAAAGLLWLGRAWSWLPVPMVQRVGAVFGWIVDVLPNRERDVASTNLAACFPGHSPEELRRLRRRVLMQTGALFGEMPATWFKAPAYWGSRVDSAAFEAHARAVLASGKGMIIAGPHLGNWELVLIVLARIAPVTAMYRPPRLPVLEPLLRQGREKGGATLVPATARGVRAVSAALGRGEIVGILPDQSPKIIQGQGAGEFAPFFGIPAYTMTLLPRLARRSGSPVVFAFAERLPAGRFRLRWCESDGTVGDNDPVAGAAALNAGVEKCVRMRPEQYLWTYKRFAPAPPGSRSLYSRKKKPGARPGLHP